MAIDGTLLSSIESLPSHLQRFVFPRKWTREEEEVGLVSRVDLVRTLSPKVTFSKETM